MANINLQNSKPSTVLVPANYPMEPTPGKISILFEANKTNLYHKFNAKNYDGGNVLFGSNQPYIYRYPDDPPSSLRQLGGRGLPLGLGVDDVLRVTKFLGSGRGLLFVAKQFTLQGSAAFDETNLYNPTEIILSAASNLTGGFLERPKRHIDKSGGLLGGLAALVGIGISRGSPPPSTVAAGNGKGGSSEGSLFGGFSLLGGGGNNRETEVLPIQNYGNATGMLRAKSANKAKSILQAKLGIDSGGGGGGIFGFIKGLAKSMFPQVFGSDKQNYKQRADELAYDWMVTQWNTVTSKGLVSVKPSGLKLSFMGINLKKPSSSELKKINKEEYPQKYFNIDGLPNKYDSLISTPEDDSHPLTSSFIAINAAVKTSDRRSNVINKDTVTKTNNELKQMLDKTRYNSVYKVNFTNKNTFLLSSGETTKQGYDRLYDIAKTPYNMGNAPNGVEKEYTRDNIKTLDSIINSSRNCGLAGKNRADKINTITILGGDRQIEKKNQLLSNYTEWKPYEDDLIAFFFYDVVNEKYIPFRCTIKGLSEQNNALWDELRYMGRADSVYSYSGFTRNLSFTFTVVVNSLLELFPVWKRLNYIAGSVKPSSYVTLKQNDNSINKFIIPPMFMLTIGDMYKYQPIVLTSVGFTIPDSAIWETVPENSTENWSYLANIIQSKVPKGRIAQLPREIDVSIACNVLEKEKPVTGGNHFGHAPSDDNGVRLDDANAVFLPKTEKFSEDLRTKPLFYDYKKPNQTAVTQFAGPTYQPTIVTAIPGSIQ